jgi:hypothetical protein
MWSAIIDGRINIDTPIVRENIWVGLTQIFTGSSETRKSRWIIQLDGYLPQLLKLFLQEMEIYVLVLIAEANSIDCHIACFLVQKSKRTKGKELDPLCRKCPHNLKNHSLSCGSLLRNKKDDNGCLPL